MREMTDERIKQAMEEYAELRSIKFAEWIRKKGITINLSYIGYRVWIKNQWIEVTSLGLYQQFKKENP